MYVTKYRRIVPWRWEFSVAWWSNTYQNITSPKHIKDKEKLLCQQDEFIMNPHRKCQYYVFENWSARYFTKQNTLTHLKMRQIIYKVLIYHETSFRCIFICIRRRRQIKNKVSICHEIYWDMCKYMCNRQFLVHYVKSTDCCLKIRFHGLTSYTIWLNNI